MGIELVYVSGTQTGAIEELSCVSLRKAVKVDDARVLPAGSSGTVVGVLKEGVAYIVEFTKPFAALVDVEIEDIEVD